MSYILITLAADTSIFQVVAHNLQPKWMMPGLHCRRLSSVPIQSDWP